MPKRTDISSILLIGSGPIVIGQACEFDYSGTQACRVLREEGYRVILANSNPATIMTDPDFADATYVEPLDVDVLTEIIAQEQPDAVLPTLGGQTALNLAMELFEAGIVGVPGTPELIGANAEAIETAEDRQAFKVAMTEIGLSVPASGTAGPPPELKRAPKAERVAAAMEVAREVIADIGLPVVIRPAYILGGKGTGIASTPEEFEAVASHGLDASPINEILIEASIAGWKEYELEVMRDRADNCVIVCSIENLDPMGVHTGDSITVAPAQTLSDVEYQLMRDAAFACIRRVGVETGGSNVQFAIDPTNGDMVVIEMNPRVSRSSALASKATGFPIAKIAARLAVGYTLDEIPNDITRKTPASFEPVIDYVVTKVPRWAFEKFPGQSATLGTQMQSVGEAMAIGRTFPESLQKALRSLEQGRLGLNCDPAEVGHRRPVRRRPAGRGQHRHPGPALPAGGRPPPGDDGGPGGRGHPGRPLVPGPDVARSPRSGRTWPASAWTGWTGPGGGGPSGSASGTPSWPGCGGSTRTRSAPPAGPRASTPPTRPSTPARPSSRPRRRTTTPPGRTPTRSSPGTGPRWSSWGRGPTASARASSSTTAACTPASPCATPASRRSWSTATRRPCRPTTTPPTGSTSSPSPPRTSTR